MGVEVDEAHIGIPLFPLPSRTGGKQIETWATKVPEERGTFSSTISPKPLVSSSVRNSKASEISEPLSKARNPRISARFISTIRGQPLKGMPSFRIRSLAQPWSYCDCLPVDNDPLLPFRQRFEPIEWGPSGRAVRAWITWQQMGRAIRLPTRRPCPSLGRIGRGLAAPDGDVVRPSIIRVGFRRSVAPLPHCAVAMDQSLSARICIMRCEVSRPEF